MPIEKKKRVPKGSGHIRERKDGTYEAQYTVGRDPGTGKQVRRSVYGKTQKEVAEKLRRITADIDAGVFMEPAKMTLGAWLDIWLAEYCSEIKKSTLSTYDRHVKKIIKPALGAVKLSALTAPAIQAFLNGLQRGKDRPKPLAPKSVHNIHGVLHKALQQAVELGNIKNNPSDACKLPRVEKALIKAMEGCEINAFLEAIRGHENERALITTIFTGMRQSELIGLTWDCVDFDRGMILLYQQLQLIDGKYETMSLKNDKTRRITPASFVMDTLREQRRVQLEWKLRAGKAWEGRNYVFTNELGEHLKRQTIYAQYKKIVASIGLPNMRFHDMRHTYAVSSLQSGDDPKTVQENLGHHTAAFTLDVYGHVTERMRKESAARMDAFIRGIKADKR